MFRSKAINIIKSLNKEEFISLGKFLNSPFFNANKNLIKLYKVLKKYYPDFEPEEFDKENLYKIIYGNSSYDYEKLKKLFSELFKELNKFLAIIGFEKDMFTHNRLLLVEFRDKKLDRLFYKKFSEANELLDNSELHYFYFLEKCLLQWEYISFHLIRDQQHKILPNIFERANYLTFFFLSDLFFNLQDIDANWMRFGYMPDKNLPKAFLDNFNIENFLKYVDDYDFKHKEMIRIYYATYLAYANFNDESYYYSLVELVFSYWDQLDINAKTVAITPLFNYCLRKINFGNYKFEQNLFNLYKKFLDSRLFDIEEYIRSDVFLCIIDNFFANKKINDAKEFFENNFKEFHPEHRNNLMFYINALKDFDEKKYGDALNNIAHIKVNAYLIKQRMKLLLLKTLYEMGLYEEAMTNATNYRKFLINNKNISGQSQEKGLKFLNFYNDILKLRFEKKDNFAIEQLKKKINENEVFEAKRWVEEKIKELG